MMADFKSGQIVEIVEISWVHPAHAWNKGLPAGVLSKKHSAHEQTPHPSSGGLRRPLRMCSRAALRARHQRQLRVPLPIPGKQAVRINEMQMQLTAQLSSPRLPAGRLAGQPMSSDLRIFPQKLVCCTPRWTQHSNGRLPHRLVHTLSAPGSKSLRLLLHWRRGGLPGGWGSR